MENAVENRPIAVKMTGVKKRYRLGQIGGTTLRADLQSWWARIRKKEDPNIRIGIDQRLIGQTFMALNGIDLTIYKGEAVGIIGGNGAGKSTLLKLLSRVTAPTEGEIDIYGRIASMLEVGTGFNPEMTGRENVYLNGAILGMTKAEIDAKMEDIIEFSEVRDFIDTPVKRYSSGMYVKLAFSVAAHLDSEIMIMDEVLAVGDMAFQKKCLNKMREAAKKDGRTVLYVSHNMSTIRQLCDRCIVLSQGKVVFEGDVEEGIEIYLSKNVEEQCVSKDLAVLGRPDNQTNDVQMTWFEYQGKQANRFNRGEQLQFAIDWNSRKDLEDIAFKIIIRYQDDTAVGVSVSNSILSVKQGEFKRTVLQFDPSLLAEGQYYLSISIFQKDEVGRDLLLDHITRAVSFIIEDNNNDKLLWHHRYWGSVQFEKLQIIEE